MLRRWDFWAYTFLITGLLTLAVYFGMKLAEKNSVVESQPVPEISTLPETLTQKDTSQQEQSINSANLSPAPANEQTTEAGSILDEVNVNDLFPGEDRIDAGEDENLEQNVPPAEGPDDPNEMAGETIPTAVPTEPAPIWDPEYLKIGFVTDIHAVSFSKTGNNELNKRTLNKLGYFNQVMKDQFKPDFIYINGDTIDGTKVPNATGVKELQMCKALLDQTTFPKYWGLGNHELRSVKKKQWEAAVQTPKTYYSFQVKNYKIIVLDTNFYPEELKISENTDNTRGYVSKVELEWLEKELKKSDSLKKIIFMHHPLFYGSGSSLSYYLTNGADVQKIFEKYDVDAVFAGHIERIYHSKIDGVNYYILPGMAKHDEYQGAFAQLEFRGNQPQVFLTYLNNAGQYITKKIE